MSVINCEQHLKNQLKYFKSQDYLIRKITTKNVPTSDEMYMHNPDEKVEDIIIIVELEKRTEFTSTKGIQLGGIDD